MTYTINNPMNKKFIVILLLVLLAISAYFAIAAVQQNREDPQEKVDALLQIQQ